MKIAAIQRILGVPADGKWGPKSQAALIAKSGHPEIGEIQHILGVTMDRKWGPKSQTALDAAKGEKVTPAPILVPPPPVVEDNTPRVDSRSEGYIAKLHPRLQPLARQLVWNAAQAGIVIKLTSGLRTYEEQNNLYAQGRSKPGNKVTNVKGGFSNHNFGLAFDITIFNGSEPIWESPKYGQVGQLGKVLGLFWGGDWTSPKDEPHFQLRPPWAADLNESALMVELRRRKDASRDYLA